MINFPKVKVLSDTNIVEKVSHLYHYRRIGPDSPFTFAMMGHGA